jgi:NAD(P)-dependent dehydrogenase (short-subunit alcohol dehydrogenase family)
VTDVPGIDPEDLASTLRVLQQLHELPADHPDHVRVKRAASHMYKSIKAERKLLKRAEELAHDRAITELTGTGSPVRIDDETSGIPLVSTAPGAFAGELLNARGCYICKNDYTLVDAFYHWLCPACAAFSHAKRDQRTDLSGKRALLTGGRAKIGMYIALRLLRDGAHTTITTRFPKDAVRRFSGLEDSGDWLHRLKIVGIDLRDPTQVISLADDVAAAGPLDILINNACQTVRRTPGSYAPLVDAEAINLPTDRALPEMVTFDRISEAHPARSGGRAGRHRRPRTTRVESSAARAGRPQRGLDDRARTVRPATPLSRRTSPAPRSDAGGLLPRRPGEQLVDPRQWAEVNPAGAARGAAVHSNRPLPAGLPPPTALAAAAGPPPRSGPARTSSTSSAMEDSFSPPATRVPGTRTPTWPRPRSTC